MPKTLSPAERQALKARAHRLDPVVMIGERGLTPAVLAEVDRALAGRDLIKIRVSGGDGDTRERFLGEICAATDASPVQHIGRILVVYRARPADAPPAVPAGNPQARRASRPAPRPGGRLPRQARLRSR